MTIKEAHDLIEAHDGEHGSDADFVTLRGFARGIAIIAKYGGDGDYDFQHDEGFFTFSEAVTADEVIELHRLGFRIDLNTDSWAKFS